MTLRREQSDVTEGSLRSTTSAYTLAKRFSSSCWIVATSRSIILRKWRTSMSRLTSTWSGRRVIGLGPDARGVNIDKVLGGTFPAKYSGSWKWPLMVQTRFSNFLPSLPSHHALTFAAIWLIRVWERGLVDDDPKAMFTIYICRVVKIEKI